jgi:DNA modification methylase
MVYFEKLIMNAKLKIEYRSIESVTPYASNARTHTKKQTSLVAGSMLEFGFMVPILIDEDDTIIAGHCRLEAAKEIGMTVIPVIQAKHLSKAQVKAFRLADNRLGLESEWDVDLLGEELKFLSSIEIDFDLSLTGFSVTETDLILGADEPLPEDDFNPETPLDENIITKRGDVWILDGHRLTCDDCRDPDVIDRLMGDSRASMVLTDPPFNVPIAGHVSGLGKHKHPEFAMASGELTPKEFSDFLRDSLVQMARASVDGSLHYVFMDWRGLPALNATASLVYDRTINLIVWAKTNSGMGSLYRSGHELILISKKGSAPHQNNVELGRHGRYRTNVWRYAGANSFGADRDESLAMHPTVKPVQMLADAILDVTRRGEIVVDGFAGSGSTLMACEQTGRICYCAEIDRSYTQVIINRWQKATGNTAIRESDGLTFQEALEQHAAEEV